MRIFIPRLPEFTTREELENLVTGALSEELHIPFTQEPQINACEVIRIKDNRGVVEYHGLIDVKSENVAQWLITHFKGQYIHNKLLFAREYKSRGVNKPHFALEDNRRRSNLEIETQNLPHIDTEDLRQFVHQHGSFI